MNLHFEDGKINLDIHGTPYAKRRDKVFYRETHYFSIKNGVAAALGTLILASSAALTLHTIHQHETKALATQKHVVEQRPPTDPQHIGGVIGEEKAYARVTEVGADLAAGIDILAALTLGSYAAQLNESTKRTILPLNQADTRSKRLSFTSEQ